jgi:predicted ester cyclase
MSAQENKTFVLRYFSALSGKDKPDTLVEEFIADSDQELKQHIALAEAAFPRYEVIAEDMVAEGDKVVVRASLRATHEGNCMGIPPTGKHVTVPFIAIYRIANGKIAEHWIQMDAMSLLRQLGAVPGPAQG